MDHGILVQDKPERTVYRNVFMGVMAEMVWKGFYSKSDERFQEILLWIKEVRRTMSKAEIKAKRHEVADCHSMPPYIRQLADKKGYYVRKCSTRRHPLRVSGYAIFKNEKDKQAKYGKKFNLTVQQVREILEAKEDK